jgi:cation diffusion facilitator family transporter
MNINRRSAGLGSSIVGLVANLILFVAKIVVGLMSGSVAVLVDAFSSLADSAGSFVGIVGFSVSGNKKTKRYPFGYGRIEYIAGMVISMIIMFTAIVIGQASFDRLMNPVPIEFSWVFVFALVASILAKTGLFVYFKRINKNVGSGILVALARDSFFDALTTIVALLPIIFHFVDFPVDGVAGLALSAFVLISGIVTFVHNAEPILGASFDRPLEAQIRREILSHDSFTRIRSMKLHNYGVDNIVGTVEVKLDPRRRRQAEADLLAVRRTLRNKYNVDATIFWR